MRAEERLWESQAQLQAILDNTQARIFTKDKLGRYLLVNKWFAQLLDLPESSIIGKTAYDLYPGDRTIADAIHMNDQRVLDEGRPVQVENGFRRKTGLTRIFL